MSFAEITIITLLVIIALILNQIKRKVHRIMTAEEKLVEYVTEIDAETTRIATLIEGLINQGTAGDLTFDELVAGLQPVVDKLKLVGTTPPVEG